MTNRSTAALIFRIWGVLWLVDAAVSLVNTALQFFTSSFGDRDVWKYAVRMNTLSWVLTSLIGLLLLVRGEAIARALFPKEESVAIDVDAATLQSIGFSLLAAYLAIGALRGIATGLYAVLARRFDESARNINASVKSGEYFVGSLVQLGLAVWLFVGTPRLVRLVRRLQEPWTSPDGGVPPEPAP